MKYARVAITEEFGPVGRIIDVQPQPIGVRAGAVAEVEVADDFDDSIMNAVIAEDGTITFEEDALKVAAKAGLAKAALIAEKYKEMDDAIFNEMQVVFGTKRSDSAAATERTLQLMKEKPALFAGEDLNVLVAAPGFAVGVPLDTETKVVDYATARLARIEEYGVFRLKKMQLFVEQKAAIEAE